MGFFPIHPVRCGAPPCPPSPRAGRLRAPAAGRSGNRW
eukprot:gene10576-biopygen6290